MNLHGLKKSKINMSRSLKFELSRCEKINNRIKIARLRRCIYNCTNQIKELRVLKKSKGKRKHRKIKKT